MYLNAIYEYYRTTDGVVAYSPVRRCAVSAFKNRGFLTVRTRTIACIRSSRYIVSSRCTRVVVQRTIVPTKTLGETVIARFGDGMYYKTSWEHCTTGIMPPRQRPTQERRVSSSGFEQIQLHTTLFVPNCVWGRETFDDFQSARAYVIWKEQKIHATLVLYFDFIKTVWD